MIGRQRLATRNLDAVEESIKYFEVAIAEDENFAQAYASLAEARMVQNNSGQLSLEDMLDYIRPLVAKARSINQEIGIVYNVMGGLAEYEGDIELAETYYLKAIEVGPSYSTAYIWLGLLHQNFTGDFEEATRLYEMALELDPAATLPKYNYAVQLANVGRRDEALEVIRKALQDAPNVSTSHMFAGEILAYSFGRFADGIRAMQRASVLDDPPKSFVGFLFAELGDFESAKLWHDAYARTYPDASFAKSLELRLLRADGEMKEAAGLAKETLQHSRDTIYEPELLRAIRDYNITVGLETDSIEKYREFYPELFRDAPDVTRANIGAAVDLVLLLKMTGRENAYLALAEGSLDLMESMPRMAAMGIGLLDVELHAILGDRNSAIAALTAANDAGLIFYLEPERHYPNLTNVAGDPEFQRLIGLIQDRVAGELHKVREMENAGRLARTPEELPNIVFDLSL